MRKGVAREAVDAALSEFFGDGLRIPLDQSRAGGGSSGGSGGAGEAEGGAPDEQAALGRELLDAARRRAAAMAGLPAEARRRRLLGYLQRRGHSWGVARQVLQALGLM